MNIDINIKFTFVEIDDNDSYNYEDERLLLSHDELTIIGEFLKNKSGCEYSFFNDKISQMELHLIADFFILQSFKNNILFNYRGIHDGKRFRLSNIVTCTNPL